MTATALRNTTVDWQASDAAHHLHPFTDHAELTKVGTRIITRAEGSHLIDSEGNRLLDAFAGLWCVNVGYGRQELAKAAYDQMLQLPYYNTFFKTSTPPAVELSKVLSDLAPNNLRHVFYGCSGSDANDTIARMVRQYWNLVGKSAKKTIISRTNGYHGSTMVAASLGGMSYMHQHADLPLPGFVHIQQPYWYGEGGDMSPEEFGLKAARALETKILELGPERCAAFIGEPIQGAGGVIMPPSTYWPEIQRICRQYDLLLIADEVICGFGRTGHWFASELYGIKADFMTLAKGITSGYVPLSAAMIGDRVADVLIASGEFDHGFTYSGHPVSCAVALENIRILKDEKMVERVHDETGPYLEKRLQELLDHPLVGEVRAPGLHRRHRAGEGQEDAPALPARGRDRHDLPRPLLRHRPGHAGDPRHHADLPAPLLDQDRDRRVRRLDPPGAGSHSGGCEAAVRLGATMPVHSVTAGALGMTEGRANPKVPGFLAEQIEAKGETVPQWLARMEARIADLMEAKMKAGFPPDLEALQKAITQDLSQEDELRKYLMALAVHRQTEEILIDRGYWRDPEDPDLWYPPLEF